MRCLKDRMINDPDSSILQATMDPPVTKSYWAREEHLKLEYDILYYSDSQGNFRIIVPRQKVQELLKLCHENIAAGHRGPDKMLRLLKIDYHWVKMKSDIHIFAQRCRFCQIFKKPTSNKLHAPLFTTKVSCPFERLSLDFAGPF